MVKLLGEKAVNAAKDAEEGHFAPSQIIWGLRIDADQERMSLPEARITKGAYLLNQPEFNYGEETLTLKDLQRFRGIANGWATIVPGLKNELKAADVFLGGVDGGATICPSKKLRRSKEKEDAWEDLWALFEDCRWLCSRSETWAEKFGGDIRELLPPMERLALPGQPMQAAVFVSSDATLTVIGAIDWTNGLACREVMETLQPWVERIIIMEGCQPGDKLAIHIGEMLSLVAFACKVGSAWTGKVVVYGGDNKVVYNWVLSRKSGVRAGRLLIRVLNLVEMRFRCRVLGGWWRTFHNEDADAITRLPEEEVEEMFQKKGWTKVDIKESIYQALEDTERFGPCFLSWAEPEDRHEKMRLQELRIFRAIHRNPQSLEELQIVEWTCGERLVKDFEYFQNPNAGGPRVVVASIGPDPHGRRVRQFCEFLNQEVFGAAVLEGPRDVAWDTFQKLANKAGFQVSLVEFLTSELGEVMARRRLAAITHRVSMDSEELERVLARSVTPPSLGTILQKAKKEDFISYQKYEPAIGQGNHVMLPVVGGHVWFEENGARHNVYRMSGPCRWPLAAKEGAGVEELYVIDKAAPAGAVRRLTSEELWVGQGRSREEWTELVRVHGEDAAIRAGSQGTGRKTALALLGLAGESCSCGNGGESGHVLRRRRLQISRTDSAMATPLETRRV